MKHPDFGILIILIGFFNGLSQLFLYCYFGKMATTNYEQIAHCMYECNWIELPVEMQKYFVLMITDAQRPIYYQGFKIAILNLETMTKVKMSIYYLR